jgi:hypothetical protein
MRYILISTLILFLISCYRGQDINDDLLENILLQHSPEGQKIIIQADNLELQILYTEIDRNDESGLRLISHGFQVDPNRYFYPAGSVRLPAAVLALERINELNIHGLNRNAFFKIEDSLNIFSEDLTSDYTIEQTIREMIMMGDNSHFDRLYDFLGQQYINEKLWSKGFNRTRILNRLSVNLLAEANRSSNRLLLFNGNDSVYNLGFRYNPVAFVVPLGEVLLGEGYYDNNEFNDEPLDFQYKNFTPLIELHHVLIYLLFPEVVPREKRFNVRDEDREFLLECMREQTYDDSVSIADFSSVEPVCFSILDSLQANTNTLQRIGISGQALGYMVENAYFYDEGSGEEFILSAVIYANENDIFFDKKYEYSQTSIPILSEIIDCIIKYERSRNVGRDEQ